MMRVAKRPPLVDAVQERIRRDVGLSFDGPRGGRQREVVLSQLQQALDAHPELPEESVALAPETLQRVCEALTVQESFFFRERAQLDWLARHVLPAMRGRERPLAVWSAGCADGQEAYTLAAVLQRAGLHGRYRILGTDLSASAVSAARRGVYGLWSLRGLDHSVVSHLLQEEAGHFTVRERFRAGLDFAQHNLMDLPPQVDGGFDLILCRNVLIYLTPPAQQRVVTRLAEALAPGGWLLTGAADPMIDGTPGLVAVATGHGAVYRRQGSSPAPAVDGRGTGQQSSPQGRRQKSRTGPRSASSRPAPQSVGATVPDLLTAAEAALESARPGQAERLARQALEQLDDSGRAHAVLVQALAQSGRSAEAARASARAVARRPLDATLWHLHAVVLLDTGDPAAAAAAAERAASLDPGMAEAHLVLARGRAALGDRAGALRARAVGRRLLSQHAVAR